MKTALITTTINVPKVLSLYRAHDPDVRFFVAGDEKTPEEGVNFCTMDIENTQFCFVEDQAKYKSSKVVGWNTDSRRNFALLEALKWGAELIVSIDDDMIPINNTFWETIGDVFCFVFSGLQLGSYKRWMDVGQFTLWPAKQRGIPPDAVPNHEPRFVTDAKIGAAQGIILGIPDADACTAIVNHPHVHSATDILRNGFVTHPESWTVFNSQLTAFRRELAPAFAQLYSAQGRNTDIFASLMMRRLMRQWNLYTYFGPPMAYHARSQRLLYNDLKSEMIGNEHIGEWADYLDRVPMTTANNVIEDCRLMAYGYSNDSLFPRAFWDAWLADCESVL